MRNAAALALAALLVGACQQERTIAPPVAENGSSENPPAPANVPASLVGEWRVAGIDGLPVNAPIGIAVKIGEQEIGFDPRCAGFTWDYRYSAGTVETMRRNPTAICTIGFDPALDRLAVALDSAETVRRTPANAIELSGGGHSVTLFSQ